MPSASRTMLPVMSGWCYLFIVVSYEDDEEHERQQQERTVVHVLVNQLVL